MKIFSNLRKINRLDTFFLFFITIGALLNQQVSVFYIVYLFWFQELLRTIINFAFALRFDNRKNLFSRFIGSLFPLFIYFVFIIILFGFMLNWNNQDLLFLNLRIMFFKNLFFNLNLIIFGAEIILYSFFNRNEIIFSDNLQIFSPRHLILHISIIFGAVIQLLIVKKYDNFFTPENLWGSVLVILPFLLLRLFVPLKLNLVN